MGFGKGEKFRFIRLEILGVLDLIDGGRYKDQDLDPAKSGNKRDRQSRRGPGLIHLYFRGRGLG